ncbi:amino acid adenylation domain-containing protein [Wukongibacter sp. M2B1]|uniref:non-ribosomal peptide synthetase n=1 Tax=Wukongibacter sp. M2B1 TaxID=3088895 RepID=UPI003D7B5311
MHYKLNEIEDKILEIWKEILEVEELTLDDEFLKIGGNSLKAIALQVQIEEEFNIEIEMVDMFKNLTARDLANYVFTKDKKEYIQIEPAEKQEYYPLSWPQEWVFFMSYFENKMTNFNLPLTMIFECELDIERLEQAFKLLVQRHETLRTTFDFIKGEPVQIIHEDIEFNLEYSVVENREINDLIEGFIRPFDLKRGPLFRAGVVKLNENKHLLIFDIHHIIFDGTSLNILLSELTDIYEGKSLSDLKIQYKDFATWQRKHKQDEFEKLQEYWSNEFHDGIPLLNMPRDYSKLDNQEYIGAKEKFVVPSDIYKRLDEFSKKYNVTMYTILLAIYNLLLSRYTNQEDIVIGTLSAGRQAAGLENLLGMFINVFPIRNRVNSNNSVLEYIGSVEESVINVFKNQNYPINELVSKVAGAENNSTKLMFDTIFIFHNQRENNDVYFSGVKGSVYEYDLNNANVDIQFDICKGENDVLNCELEYNSNLYRKESIRRMIGHFLKLAEEMFISLDKKVSDINMLTIEEKDTLLKGFNETFVDYNKNSVFHKLFEEQVERTPDKIAVVYENDEITYSELNKKANQLAYKLRDLKIDKGSVIALMSERSIEMIIGILGIIKAGGVYLPIDPEYPRERIEYMLEDSNSKGLITLSDMAEKIDFGRHLIFLDDEELYRGDNRNLENINSPEDLIYIIYTSGTTGSPKGAMIEHRNLVNAAMAWRHEYKLKEFEVNLLQIAKFTFDVSIGDLTKALTNGGKLVICPKEDRYNIPKIYSIIKAKEISIIDTVPSLIVPLMDYIYESNLSTEALKLLIFGGDKCSLSDFKRLLQRYGNKIRIVNGYGITEATIESSYFEEDIDKIVSSGSTPIGKPFNNIRYYILDSRLKLKPIGVPGELYISGDCLGRGYLNNPKLTSEKFVPNPYEIDSRMYRTGDIAKWLPDGNVEFLGRIDQQIKINGFRIEVEEIEAHLLKFDGLKEVAVVAQDIPGSSNKNLVAFYTSDEEVNGQSLKEYLLKKLPEYMLPTFFIKVDEIPLSSNGKIDRRALKQVQLKVIESSVFVNPENEREEKLIRIWNDILNVDEIGACNDFFEIGGSSLKAIVLSVKINDEFGVQIPLVDIFELKTVRKIAERIERLEGNSVTSYFNNAVLLKEGNEENLFLIHSGNGLVDGYVEFCKNSKLDYSCWGIKADKIDNFSPKNTNVSEIAEKYIKVIRSIQPQGPYNIVGWCLGGTIAFEIVRQLELENEEIKIFAMFNSSPPNGNDSGDVFKFEGEYQLVKDIFPQIITDKIYESEKEKEHLWMDVLDQLHSKDIDMEYMINNVDKKILEFVPYYETMTLNEYIYALNLRRTLGNAVSSYIPKSKIQSKMYYFRANEEQADSRNCWSQYSINEMETYIVDGDNDSMMEMPNVLGLAKKFDNAISSMDENINDVEFNF